MLSTNQIKELNKRYSGVRFFEALKVVRDPDADPIVIDCFANYPDEFEFDGNTYHPLEILFLNEKRDSTMSLPVEQVNVSNAGNRVIDYIEDEELGVVLNYNNVTKQIISWTPAGNLFELYQEITLQALLIADDVEAATATLYLGLNVRLEDDLPIDTLEIPEFPGLRADVGR